MKTKFAQVKVSQSNGFSVDYPSRIITGASAITIGEAKGHGLWIDRVALEQFASLANASAGGIRVRYGHPTICFPDGLSKQIGRASGFYIDNDKLRVGKVSFYKRATGARAEMIEDILNLASEDPDSFGFSFSFYRDIEAEAEFMRQHVNEDGEFVSPDSANVNNYPHVRVSEIEAIDFVDFPAANRSLFGANTINGVFLGRINKEEIASLVKFIIGYDQYTSALKKVDSTARMLFRDLGIDIDDVREFVSSVMEEDGLVIIKAKDLLEFGISPDEIPYRKIDLKVISYDSAHPGGTKKAPENTPWDGPAEVAKADVNDLKVMCAWYDSSKPDVKSSYKLPHHRASDKAVVWRAVANAAARLPITDIPDSDKAGVRKHLGRHYREFGKTAPWDSENVSVVSNWEKYCFAAVREFGTFSDVPDDAVSDLLMQYGFSDEASAIADAHIEFEHLRKIFKMQVESLISRRIDEFLMKVTGKVS